jgi:choline dehydrogenase
MTERYDHVVVGGGSAGWVVINRLVSAGKSVLLREADEQDNSSVDRGSSEVAR